jgi:hypothetical protein
MGIETHDRGGSHLTAETIRPTGERGRTSETVIPDRRTAQDRMKDTAELTAFLEAIDFDRSYLVVGDAAAWPSGYRLELAEILRADTGLQIEGTVVSPDESVGDDAPIHSLAIRIADEHPAPPETVDATVSR